MPNEDGGGETGQITMGGNLMIDLSSGSYTSPAAAIKEYVSNSWDAGASDIKITIFNPDERDKIAIEILDDGGGMSREDFEEKFFRVGRNRRAEEGEIVDTIRGKRRVHGRKGLGKFAGLKICRRLTVVSWTDSEDDGVEVTGAYVDMDEIEANPNDDPEFHFIESDRRDDTEHGTQILLTKYAPGRQRIDMDSLAYRLSKWFEFGNEATVRLRGAEGSPGDSEVAFDREIGRDLLFAQHDFDEETLTIEYEDPDGETKERDVEVRWAWLETSDTSVRSLISVVSNERALSTEERFDVQTGWTNQFGIYKLLAEFRGDWIDTDLPVDPADLKREGVNWEAHPALEALRKRGAEWVKQKCRSRARDEKAKETYREKIRETVDDSRQFEEWSSSQKDKLVSLATAFASKSGTSERNVDQFVELVAFLLEHETLISFIEELKEGHNHTLEEFLDLSQRYNATQVTNLLAVTRNRLLIVEELQDLITDPETLEVDPEDTDITDFIAKSPWIFDPELRFDHGDHTMKRILLESFEGTDAEVETAELNALADRFLRIRPDLVTYDGPGAMGNPLCVELKSPTHEMTEDEAQRVVNYRAAFMSEGYNEVRYVVVSGSYSGEAHSILESIDVEIYNYADLLDRARAQLQAYIDKLEEGRETVEAVVPTG